MCMHMIIVRCFCFQKKRNVKVQVSTQSKTFKNQGCQTEESYLKDSARPQLEDDIEMEDDCLDLNWEPGIKKEDVGVTVTLSPPVMQSGETEIKCLIFHSQLMLLLENCRECGRKLANISKGGQSTMVSFSYICQCGAKFRWSSQTHTGSMTNGNQLTAAAVMFSGGSPNQILNMFRHLKLQCFIQRTYLRLQNINLIPTIKDVYLSQQQTLLYQAKSNLSVRVAGDGRCCSPGHTAKYGSYTLLEVNSGKIISRQLVQVNLLYV